jgi:hypothetical protein
MPLFVVRLEDPDSEHFRETTLEAKDEKAARWYCEGRERRIVDFSLPADEHKDLVKRRDSLGGREKARLLTHEQTAPYEVVSVKKA